MDIENEVLLRAEQMQVQNVRHQPVTIRLRPGDSVRIDGLDANSRTALLRAFARITPVASGRLFWNDVEVTRRPRWTLGRLRDDIALLWANPYALFANSSDVRSTLRGRETESPVREHLQAVGLSTATLSFKVQALSGAQRVRLALAYVRQRSPKVLLVDDLFAHLAPETWSDIITSMKRLMSRGALVIASRYQAVTETLDPLYTKRLEMSSDTLP